MSQYEEPREPAWLDGLLKGLNEGGFGLEGTALADLLWLSPKLRVLAGSNQAETVEKTQRQGLVNPSSSLSRTGSRREDRGRDYDVSGRAISSCPALGLAPGARPPRGVPFPPRRRVRSLASPP